jgi:hypothetical protein
VTKFKIGDRVMLLDTHQKPLGVFGVVTFHDEAESVWVRVLDGEGLQSWHWPHELRLAENGVELFMETL